ncbi:flavin-containing monooxygenase 5-like [Carcharodon carcharias]|uniref:flavin-containing monooxygenase 5-like n=1 Tax=Carcharodon carcharias TaxID=13397 RepID=UPI001B7F0C40|nr:flavin-containing monooxygenase 5-like [Carcharodon carcharias]
MMCYSDFPFPDDYPNFMHNTRILQYLRLYIQKFDLMKYIQLKTDVCSVVRREDFSSTGQWDVTTKDSEGNTKTSIFDAIMVCTGHHCYPHMPLDSFPGIEKFKGQYSHSKSYRDPQNFEGKRVVVIGVGNTGGDLAVDISRTAKQVFLSTRSGIWVFSRLATEGYPVDMMLHNRYACLMGSIFPASLVSSYYERTLNNRFNHANYGLQANHRALVRQPMVSDELPSRIISGAIQVKPNVKHFTETSAVFVDGSVEDIDSILFATGYSVAYPFLEEAVTEVRATHVSLYKHVFPPQLEQPTLAIIGLIDPLVAIMPISEMQSRWATRVFKGLAKLPPAKDMLAEITNREEKILDRSGGSQKRTLKVDYIPYMDAMAEQIGAKLDLKHLFLADPRLAFQIFFGPCSPYQFRLMGPGRWDGARQAILTQWDRAMKPTKTRILAGSQEDATLSMLLKAMALLVVICAVFLFL